MTFRELFDLMHRHIEEHPEDEALDREVVVRVVTGTADDEGDLHVGGLRSASIDAGCTDHPALTLDADQDQEAAVDDFDEDTAEEVRPS